MNKVKKVILSVSVAVLFVCVFVACGNTPSTQARGRVTEEQWVAAFNTEMFGNVTIDYKTKGESGFAVDLIMKFDIPNGKILDEGTTGSESGQNLLMQTESGVVRYSRENGEEWGKFETVAPDMESYFVMVTSAMFEDLGTSYSKYSYSEADANYVYRNAEKNSVEIVGFADGKLAYMSYTITDEKGNEIYTKHRFYDYGTTVIDVDVTNVAH